MAPGVETTGAGRASAKARSHSASARERVWMPAMMTGRSEPADVARGLTLGADGYVTKPFKITGLVAAINAVLDGSQARPA